MEEHGYTVVQTLGQGGSSRVYEVKDSQGTVCVLKQIPFLGKDGKEKAELEVRLLATLRHPCIVPYLESFLARSTPSLPSEDVICIVMSRCEHDLRQQCLRQREQGTSFEESSIVSWLMQLCWGLQHLHARKFLHRDLKPQNVLLTRTGRVLLADFGVVGHLEHTEDFKQSIVGTPAFMSPEMLEGRPYGCKTDIWALGCVLFEMMALEPPFVSCASYAAVVIAVLQPAPHCAPRGYGQELSATVESLMARRPDDRPSCAELLSGKLLSKPFRSFLQSIDDNVHDTSSNAVLSSKLMEQDGEYDSDFESYSGSEDASNVGQEEPNVTRKAKSIAIPRDEWQRLMVEATALLQPMHKLDTTEEMTKIRLAIQSTLGSEERVDQALNFLRDRKPLGDSDVIDELVLQVEIVDLVGEEGIHALPLLERYLSLETHQDKANHDDNSGRHFHQ